MTKQIGFVLVLTLVLLGCETVDSNTIRGNDELYASFEITANRNGTTNVLAEIRIGGPISNVSLDLESGDQLVSYSGSEVEELARHRDLFGPVQYRGTLGVNAPGTPVRIAFFRQNDADAPQSTVTLPPFVDVTGPSSGTVFSWGSDDITVTWSPVGQAGKVDVIFSGRCGTTSFLEHRAISGDPGRATYEVASLLSEAIRDGGSDCSVEVAVERTNEGTLDPGFGAGGVIKAMRRDVVSVSFVR